MTEPASGRTATPNVETLRLAYAEYTAEVSRSRTELNGIYTHIGASLASAGLILGLFGAFRPEKDSVLTSALFAAGVLPFLGIVFLSLLGGLLSTVEPWIERILGPGILERKALEELVADEDWGSELAQNLARAAGEGKSRGRASVSLAPEQWLLAAIEDLERAAIYLEKTIIDARETYVRIALLLGVEVVYLAVVTTISPFIA